MRTAPSSVPKSLLVPVVALVLMAGACAAEAGSLGPAPTATAAPRTSPPTTTPASTTTSADTTTTALPPTTSLPQTSTTAAAPTTTSTDQMPSITVSAPTAGETVSSPVTVAGTADVFEATVSIRVLDSTGAEIARTFTNATCGTGCRGDYTTSVTFSVDHAQPGTIQVFAISPKDGSEVDVQSIPVVLSR